VGGKNKTTRGERKTIRGKNGKKIRSKGEKKGNWPPREKRKKDISGKKNLGKKEQVNLGQEEIKSVREFKSWGRGKIPTLKKTPSLGKKGFIR